MKINPYVIPFQEVTAQTLKNYFLKQKAKTSRYGRTGYERIILFKLD